jgi:hypothetical protein
MKQHTPMVNSNYLSKCPLMHNQNFHSNKKHVASCGNWIKGCCTIDFIKDGNSFKSMVTLGSLIWKATYDLNKT